MPASHEQLRLIQGKSSLKELIQACPDLWQETGGEINRRLAAARDKSGARSQGGLGEAGSASLNSYVTELNGKAEAWSKPLANSRFNLGMVERAFPDIIRARMAWLALQNYYLAALGGQPGKIRFNLWNGTILQKLLFRRGFERKPVSLFWYGLGWRLVTQKKILMRLVYKKGIYCFYSRRLIRELARLIRETREGDPAASPVPALEIAAGDGTLSRFLRNAGLDIVATDDLSWEATAKAAAGQPPGDVVALDAARAIRQYSPETVVCSWPPAGNAFERQVFASPSTRLYLVIGSRHMFASGNWDTYRQWAVPVGANVRAAVASTPPTAVETAADTRPFTMELDERLSSLVLPRELDNAVLIFRRR